MGLSAAKTAADVTLALAGEKDWKEVRQDVVGFALFGAGRLATGMARSLAGSRAKSFLRATREEMNALTAERAARAKAGIEESAQLRSLRSASLRELRQEARTYQPIAKKLRKDAATSFWHQSVRMLRERELELPREAMLGFGHDVTVLGTIPHGIKLYGQQKHIHELAEHVSNVLPHRQESSGKS
jgi:hypothetical protein